MTGNKRLVVLEPNQFNNLIDSRDLNIFYKNFID